MKFRIASALVALFLFAGVTSSFAAARHHRHHHHHGHHGHHHQRP